MLLHASNTLGAFQWAPPLGDIDKELNGTEAVVRKRPSLNVLE